MTDTYFPYSIQSALQNGMPFCVIAPFLGGILIYIAAKRTLNWLSYRRIQNRKLARFTRIAVKSLSMLVFTCIIYLAVYPVSFRYRYAIDIKSVRKIIVYADDDGAFGYVQHPVSQVGGTEIADFAEIREFFDLATQAKYFGYRQSPRGTRFLVRFVDTNGNLMPQAMFIVTDTRHRRQAYEVTFFLESDSLLIIPLNSGHYSCPEVGEWLRVKTEGQ